MSRLLAQCLVLICGLALTVPLASQASIEVTGPSPALVQLGRASRLVIQADRAQADLQFQVPQVPGLRMRVGAPSRQTQISTFNGRTRRQETITQVVELTPTREGVFTVPRFEVRAGSAVRQVGPLRVECKADPTGDEYASVRALSVPEKVFVAQPVRLGVEYEIDASLRLLRGRSSYDIWVDAVWLDETDGTVVIERGDAEDGVPMQINREVRSVPMERVQRGGREFFRFRYETVVQPSAAGTFEFDRPILRFGVETGRSRTGLFGERVGRQQERLISYGQATRTEVVPLPIEGQPADFGGAVGRFTVATEVSMDGLPVTEVEAGRTLRWTFRIRSQGPLGFFRDPVLKGSEAFREIGRRERREGDEVVIDFDLQPVRSGRQRLPELDWVVFDTGAESYRSLTGDPFEIDVRPAPEGAGLDESGGERSEAVIPGVDDIHEGLSLEDWSELQQRTWPESPSVRERWLAVVGPFALALLVFLLRRFGRRILGRGPGRQRLGKRAFYRAMNRGAHIDEAVRAYLAAWLDLPSAATVGPDLAERLADAGVDASWSDRLADLLLRSTAARYGAGTGPTFDEVEQTLKEFDRARSGERPARSAAPAAVLLGFAVAVAGSTLRAQEESRALVEQAYDSYSQARYAEAAQLYERAIASGASPVFHRNLGNAWYRSGENALAILAWERALLVTPGDSKLRENIDLAEKQLELADDETRSMMQSWGVFARWCGERSLLWWTGGFALLASSLLLFGRGGWRAVAIVPTALALLGAAELLVLGPRRPGRGVVLIEKAEVRAEPQPSLEPVFTLRAGARCEVLAVGPDWVRVQVRDRTGFVPRAAIEPIEPRP